MAIDDEGKDASAPQLGGQRETDRSGADDENFRLSVHGICPFWRWRVAARREGIHAIPSRV